MSSITAADTTSHANNAIPARPTIVLLPGMDGTGELFGPFIHALDGAFDIQVVGYPTDRALGYDALEALVRSTLPRDRPFILLGESFSGPIAVSIAASPPPGLQALVLCASFAACPMPGLAPLQRLVRHLPIEHTPLGLLGWLLMGSRPQPGLRAALATSLSQLTPAALRARVAAVLAVDHRDLLPRIRIPTLYLQARRDRVVPRRSLAPLQRHVSYIHKAGIDAPHFLLQTAATQAADTLRSFVDTIQRTARRADGAETPGHSA
ncbi:MAG: alpha/beta fold hydrolase [Rhodocyclaceae bacterium]